MKQYDEYITTRAHIGPNTNAFRSDFIKPLKPEGEGWEYLDSCCTDQFMYWNWGRVIDKVKVSKHNTIGVEPIWETYKFDNERG